MTSLLPRFSSLPTAVAIALILGLATPGQGQAQVTAFRQAVAETVAGDDALAAFYRGRGFEGLWTGSDADAIARRNALLSAFADAAAHGLPARDYDAQALMARLHDARTAAERGAMDVELTRLFLGYAQDMQTGVLSPGRVVPAIKREVPLRDPLDLITAFASAEPRAFLRDLAPKSPEYTRLMREKLRLEGLMAQGGWGPQVPAGKLEPGDTGPAVIALRNRLVAMGHLGRSHAAEYDGQLRLAVENFQATNGLTVDGTVGEATLRAINTPIDRRIAQIIVAMERERWTNMDRGDRHIWVNLTDFTARIVDNDIVTFETRSVIGARDDDRQSPEFSDIMEFMVINPSWYVPRSIVTKEYLPQLQRNPNAVRHLIITDSRGRQINRGAVNFAGYTQRNFPFSMRQAPGANNALGRVKFMFPNRYNIYLHDTPAKSLFGREVRAFSHGCIRLNDPFDFAYALLAKQEGDPVGFFQSRLRSGAETRVNLDQPVPVHIVYRTAFTDATGQLQFRRDIYDRDARIWSALQREGVAVLAPQG